VSSDLSESVAKVKALLLPPDMETTAYPVLILVCGLPGSGKSYLSERLAEQLAAVIIESDCVRKALFPQPTFIFDATNIVEFQRELLYSLAERSDAHLLIVRTVAPEEVIRERLTQRKAGADSTSDADWSVYRRMARREQRIRRPHLRIDTSQDIDHAVRKIMRAAHRCMRT